MSYIAKGLLPYRGLGSGIKRAVENWPALDFTDDREGSLFTATIHRNSDDVEKTSERVIELLQKESSLSACSLAGILGLSPRAVELQLARLRNAGRIRRIGPDKGGRWEVVA